MSTMISTPSEKSAKVARKAKDLAVEKATAAKAEAQKAATKQADEVVRLIQDEQKKLVLNEGHVVIALIAIGVGLVALQAATKATRDWTKRVKNLGYNPRVARRLQALGSSWWGQSGPMGPEIVDRLPADVHKLVAIARLPSDRLPGFLDRIDCKEEGRQRVIDAVMSELGEGKKPRGKRIHPDKVVAAFEQAATRTVAALKGAIGAIADDMRDRLHKALDAALDEPQAAPASATTPPDDTPEAMPGS